MTSPTMNVDSEDDATAVPLAPSQIVGSWLATFANGQVKDQNAAFLEKVIRTRVEEARAKLKTIANGNAINAQRIIEGFVATYVENRGALDATNAAAERLDEYVRKLIAAATDSDGTDGGNVEPSAIVDELSATVREQQQHVSRLEDELVRAHDWRYHLETHAREVRAELLRQANEDHAPTPDSLRALASTLQAGIGWAP